MDLWNDTERNLVELNTELSRSGDPARIRYMVIQPDPDWIDEWMVTTVWELPPPDPGREVWPDHKLVGYERMLEDRLAGVASTSCLAEVARPYRRNVKATARRLVEHGKARSVCDTLKGNNRADPNLREFAKRFVPLYLSRQRADYDHTYEPDKSDAQEAIERARYGINYLSEARTTSPDQVQRMCIETIASDTQRKHIARQSGR